MTTKIKLVLAGIGALIAFLWAAMSRRSPWEARAKEAQAEATTAKHEAVDASADKQKAEVITDAKNAADAVDDMADADLYAEALEELGLDQRPGD